MNAKVYATIKSPFRSDAASATKFNVDYFFLSGPLRNDSVALLPLNFNGEPELKHKLKVLLIDYLEQRYPPEQFKTSDIIFS